MEGELGPIEDGIMGDVWPAVEPGCEPGDYGSASLDPTGPCEVRSHQTFRITYTVGRFGLDDTGAIRIAFRFVHDGGAFQTSDPAAPNYVTAEASNGARLTVFPEPYAYRPWLIAIRVTVNGGYMREDDTITVTIGDRSGGSPGFVLQTICEQAFEFKVSVDACATGQFSPLADRLFVPVVAGPAHRWKLVGPGQRRPGEVFSLGIKAEDFWGNPTVPDLDEVRLGSASKVAGLPASVRWDDGSRAMRVEGLSVDVEGLHRIALTATDGGQLAVSNPIVIRDEGVAGYWGDLHGQSGETVGIGAVDEYLAFARDLAFLDVSGHQANDFQIANAFWQQINDVTAEMNVDGSFVVYPGYEWSANTPVGGDHNVFFRHEGRQIRRSSHAMLADRSDLASDANTLGELFEQLSHEDCVVWAHVGGRPADVSVAHDADLKTAVEVHSNWGTFEWIVTDSLALGHRIGIVGSSDGHKGRPGASPPGATEFGAYGGLTCFYAAELTRDAIFGSMRQRHHYATSGARIHLDVRARFGGSSEEARMGDIVRCNQAELALAVETAGETPVVRLDVLNGADEVSTVRHYASNDLGRRLRVIWQGAEYRGRGRNTHWQGRIRVNGTDILEIIPVNQWNPERRLELEDAHTVAFDAVTSGNFAGVDLVLRDEEAEVIVETNLVNGRANVADLGLEGRVFDAGGLERQIRLVRLPDAITEDALEAVVPVALAEDGDNAIWVRVTTLDGHQAWSSPIYVERG